MSYVIRCMQDEPGNVIPEQLLSLHGGRGLKRFDPNACDGRGSVEWTNDLGQALQFSDVVEAAEFYRQQSKVRPLKDDGEPNRTLTEYTLTLETFDSPQLSEPAGMRKWWRRLRG